MAVKLTWEQVREIRSVYNPMIPGHAALLAGLHGITREYVFMLLRGTDRWPLERYVVNVVRGYSIAERTSSGNHRKQLPVEACVLDTAYSWQIVARYQTGGGLTEAWALAKADAAAARLNAAEREWEQAA